MNQNCPVLILNRPPFIWALMPLARHANGNWFVEGAEEIANYLAAANGSGIPH
jgi:hypothetical protein